jgi:hypothetical protein
MPGRRRILQGMLGLLLTPAWGSFAVQPTAAAGHGFHLVNGWILTGRDLALLDAPADRRPG